jgi:hypothetical protein
MKRKKQLVGKARVEGQERPVRIWTEVVPATRMMHTLIQKHGLCESLFTFARVVFILQTHITACRRKDMKDKHLKSRKALDGAIVLTGDMVGSVQGWVQHFVPDDAHLGTRTDEVAEYFQDTVREHGFAVALSHLVRVLAAIEHALGNPALPGKKLPDSPSSKARLEAREIAKRGQEAITDWMFSFAPEVPV